MWGVGLRDGFERPDIRILACGKYQRRFAFALLDAAGARETGRGFLGVRYRALWGGVPDRGGGVRSSVLVCKLSQCPGGSL